MFSKMKLEIDDLLSDISRFGKIRQEKIKTLEGMLLQQVENELIKLLTDHGFSIVEHQLNDWIVAVRGRDKLRVWFPKQGQASHTGVYSINFVLNDIKCAIGVVVKHRFANVDYNYLCVDYEQELLDQIDKLKRQLEELKEIGTTDIDGSCLACRFYERGESEVTFQTLGSCLTQLIDEAE